MLRDSFGAQSGNYLPPCNFHGVLAKRPKANERIKLQLPETTQKGHSSDKGCWCLAKGLPFVRNHPSLLYLPTL
jgi:hypothetical protein